jgi:hypothetical protein
MTLTATNPSVIGVLAGAVASINMLDDFAGVVQFGYELTDDVGEIEIVEADASAIDSSTTLHAVADALLLGSSFGEPVHPTIRVNPFWLAELVETHDLDLIQGEAHYWLNCQVTAAMEGMLASV